MAVTLEKIYQAADAIAGRVVKTPCRRSRTLSTITGADVRLKFENQQFTASFKDRGALVKLLGLSSKQRKSGVIAMSAGNHAQGVALAATWNRIPSTIVMPIDTPLIKVERTKGYGGEVILHGTSIEETFEKAAEIVRQRGITFIHPFDDLAVIAGQGTIGLELLSDCPDLRTVLVPIGGGGLISGIGTALKALNPNIRVIGVQAAGANSAVGYLRPFQAGSAIASRALRAVSSS